MKIGLVAASLVLVAGGVSGCSNSASKEDFCAGYEDFLQTLFSSDSESENFVEDLKDAASDFQDVGTPDDIPDDAKEGLEIAFSQVDGLDDDATPEEFEALDSELSDDEREKTDAFSDYVNKTCPNAGADLG